MFPYRTLSARHHTTSLNSHLSSVFAARKYELPARSPRLSPHQSMDLRMVATSSKQEESKETEFVPLPTNDESPGLVKIRHSSAHIMAMAVQRLFPKAQVNV